MGQRNERIRAVLELATGPRVLHVGCANNRFPRTKAELGHWLHGALIEAGWSVLGADINREHLAEMARAGYEVTYLDAMAIPEEGERFDSIVAGELIEHIENPGLFLNGCRKRLAPGGRLVLTTPNAFGVMDILGYVRKFDRAFHPEHTCWFDAQTLRQMLERCGFRVEELRFVDNLRPDVIEAREYRLFARSWMVARRYLPARYRNTLVALAVPVPDAP